MDLFAYIRAAGRQDLLQEWDRSGNQALELAALSPHSREKLGWVCARGHRWRATLDTRMVLSRGCPYCAGQRVLPGETDLAATHPDLAARWHPTKNAPLTPRQVMPGSHRMVWWQCEQGHDWQAAVYSQVGGSGCPYCAGKLPIPGKTDLAATHPALAGEWDREKNGSLTPQQVTPGSTKEVWWRCGLGHSYRAKIFSRAAGTGCPYCAGRRVLPGFNDLASTDPAAAEQWYQPLNGFLTPQQVTRGSHRKVWWQCAQGHVWQAAVFSRTRRRASDCPVCAGRVKVRPAAYGARPHPREDRAQYARNGP